MRRGQLDWALAAGRGSSRSSPLPRLANVRQISVAVAPDGERSVYVLAEGADGEGVDRAVDELERRGRERFDAFVARAEQASAGWKLTVDPL